MVRLAGLNAINQGSKQQPQHGTETIEAAEGRVATDYEHALRLIAADNPQEAKATLQRLLHEPLLQNKLVGANAHMVRQLRFLVLKNLAGLEACDGECGAIRALGLYGEAAQLEPGDLLLWSQLGTLAASIGELAISRHAFEVALELRPSNVLLREKLLAVLVAAGDRVRAKQLLQQLLAGNPAHPWAANVLQAVQTCGSTASVPSRMVIRKDAAAEHQDATYAVITTVLSRPCTWDHVLATVLTVLQQQHAPPAGNTAVSAAPLSMLRLALTPPAADSDQPAQQLVQNKPDAAAEDGQHIEMSDSELQLQERALGLAGIDEGAPDTHGVPAAVPPAAPAAPAPSVDHELQVAGQPLATTVGTYAAEPSNDEEQAADGARVDKCEVALTLRQHPDGALDAEPGHDAAINGSCTVAATPLQQRVSQQQQEQPDGAADVAFQAVQADGAEGEGADEAPAATSPPRQGDESGVEDGNTPGGTRRKQPLRLRGKNLQQLDTVDEEDNSIAAMFGNLAAQLFPSTTDAAMQQAHAEQETGMPDTAGMQAMSLPHATSEILRTRPHDSHADDPSALLRPDVRQETSEAVQLAAIEAFLASQPSTQPADGWGCALVEHFAANLPQLQHLRASACSGQTDGPPATGHPLLQLAHHLMAEQLSVAALLLLAELHYDAFLQAGAPTRTAASSLVSPVRNSLRAGLVHQLQGRGRSNSTMRTTLATAKGLLAQYALASLAAPPQAEVTYRLSSYDPQLLLRADGRPDGVMLAQQQGWIEQQVRFHWLRGLLAVEEDDAAAVTKHLETCRHWIRQRAEERPLMLVHLHQHQCIDEEVLAAKLEGAKLSALMEHADEVLATSGPHQLVQVLTPVLLEEAEGDPACSAGRTASSPATQAVLLQQHPAKRIRALKSLAEAASEIGERQLQLRCSIRMCELLLLENPRGHPDVRDKTVASLQTLQQLMTDNAVLVRGWLQADIVLEQDVQRLELQLLRQLQVLARDAEAAPAIAGGRRALLSKRVKPLQKAATAMCQTLLVCRTLDGWTAAAWPSLEALLSGLCRLLARTGALHMEGCAFLRMAASGVAGLLRHQQVAVKSAGVSDTSGTATDVCHQLAVDLPPVLAQMLYALYGLDLPLRDESWAHGSCQPPPSGDVHTQPQLQDKDSCLAFWDVFEPLIPDLLSDELTLGRNLPSQLQDLLRCFPRPPQHMMGPDGLVEQLQEAALDEASVLAGELPRWMRPASDEALVPEAQQAGQARTQRLQVERSVYRNLYYLWWKLWPEAVEGVEPQQLLDATAEPAIAAFTCAEVNDLVCCPDREESWERLQDAYEEFVEVLQKEACEKLSQEDWPTSPARGLLQKLRRRLRNVRLCHRMCLQVTANALRSEIATLQLAATVGPDALSNPTPPHPTKAAARDEPQDDHTSATARAAADQSVQVQHGSLTGGECMVEPDGDGDSSHADASMGPGLLEAKREATRTVSGYIALVDEGLMTDDYMAMRNAPPDYNQIDKVPDRLSSGCRFTLTRALAAVERAGTELVNEWEYQYWRGKIKWKLDNVNAVEVLHLYARANYLYTSHVRGTALEPLYRLHATRSKVLQSWTLPSPAAVLHRTNSGQLTVTDGTASASPLQLKDNMPQRLLQLVARYCFEDSTDADVAALLQRPFTTEIAQQVVQLLLEDTTAALQWMLSQDKHYHKARRRLACIYLHRGMLFEAVATLRYCFVRPIRGTFHLNMEALKADTTTGCTSRKHRQSHSRDAAVEQLPEEQWGRRPPRCDRVGLDESYLCFSANVRRCVVLYLRLLCMSGDVEQLHSVHSGLVAGSHQQLNSPRNADLRRLAVGCYVSTLLHQLQRVMPLRQPPLVTPSAEPQVRLVVEHPSLATTGSVPMGASSVPSTDGIVTAGEAGFALVSQVVPVHDAAQDVSVVQLLERGYQLFVDMVLRTNAEATWQEAVLPCIREAERVLQAPGWKSWHCSEEQAAAVYSRAYLCHLKHARNVDTLLGLLSALKKRFRNLKLAPSAARHVWHDIQAAVASAVGSSAAMLQQRCSQLIQPETLQRQQHGGAQQDRCVVPDGSGEQDMQDFAGQQTGHRDARAQEHIQDVGPSHGRESRESLADGTERVLGSESAGQAVTGAPAMAAQTSDGRTVAHLVAPVGMKAKGQTDTATDQEMSMEADEPTGVHEETQTDTADHVAMASVMQDQQEVQPVDDMALINKCSTTATEHAQQEGDLNTVQNEQMLGDTVQQCPSGSTASPQLPRSCSAEHMDTSNTVSSRGEDAQGGMEYGSTHHVSEVAASVQPSDGSAVEAMEVDPNTDTDQDRQKDEQRQHGQRDGPKKARRMTRHAIAARAANAPEVTNLPKAAVNNEDASAAQRQPPTPRQHVQLDAFLLLRQCHTLLKSGNFSIASLLGEGAHSTPDSATLCIVRRPASVGAVEELLQRCLLLYVAALGHEVPHGARLPAADAVRIVDDLMRRSKTKPTLGQDLPLPENLDAILMAMQPKATDPAPPSPPPPIHVLQRAAATQSMHGTHSLRQGRPDWQAVPLTLNSRQGPPVWQSVLETHSSQQTGTIAQVVPAHGAEQGPPVSQRLDEMHNPHRGPSGLQSAHGPASSQQGPLVSQSVHEMRSAQLPPQLEPPGSQAAHGLHSSQQGASASALALSLSTEGDVMQPAQHQTLAGSMGHVGRLHSTQCMPVVPEMQYGSSHRVQPVHLQNLSNQVSAEAVLEIANPSALVALQQGKHVNDQEALHSAKDTRQAQVLRLQHDDGCSVMHDADNSNSACIGAPSLSASKPLSPRQQQTDEAAAGAQQPLQVVQSGIRPVNRNDPAVQPIARSIAQEVDMQAAQTRTNEQMHTVHQAVGQTAKEQLVVQSLLLRVQGMEPLPQVSEPMLLDEQVRNAIVQSAAQEQQQFRLDIAPAPQHVQGTQEQLRWGSTFAPQQVQQIDEQLLQLLRSQASVRTVQPGGPPVASRQIVNQVLRSTVNSVGDVPSRSSFQGGGPHVAARTDPPSYSHRQQQGQRYVIHNSGVVLASSAAVPSTQAAAPVQVDVTPIGGPPLLVRGPGPSARQTAIHRSVPGAPEVPPYGVYTCTSQPARPFTPATAVAMQQVERRVDAVLRMQRLQAAKRSFAQHPTASVATTAAESGEAADAGRPNSAATQMQDKYIVIDSQSDDSGEGDGMLQPNEGSSPKRGAEETLDDSAPALKQRRVE